MKNSFTYHKYTIWFFLLNHLLSLVTIILRKSCAIYKIIFRSITAFFFFRSANRVCPRARTNNAQRDKTTARTVNTPHQVPRELITIFVQHHSDTLRLTELAIFDADSLKCGAPQVSSVAHLTLPIITKLQFGDLLFNYLQIAFKIKYKRFLNPIKKNLFTSLIRFFFIIKIFFIVFTDSYSIGCEH